MNPQNKQLLVRVIASISFKEMRANGVANVAGGRARTFQSGRDRSRNPRLQRKNRGWKKEWE